MKVSILVIDGNPAVQALASAALSKVGAQVEALADGEKAWLRISTVKPRIVFCAHDIAGLEPISLCERIKREKALRQTIFVLLAPSDQRREISQKLHGTVIDKILYKPFKSDQLRQLVESLLSGEGDRQQRSCGLLIQNSFARRVLEKTLTKAGMTPVHLTGPEMLQQGTSLPQNYAGSIVDAAYLPALSGIKNSGQLAILFQSDEEAAKHLLPEGARALVRPLSLRSLESGLRDILAPLNSQRPENRPLDTGEQALLAARISATVFERLVNQESLRLRNWEEACAQLSGDMLRICREFKD